MTARVLMIQDSSSSAGKSLLVTAWNQSRAIQSTEYVQQRCGLRRWKGDRARPSIAGRSLRHCADCQYESGTDQTRSRFAFADHCNGTSLANARSEELLREETDSMDSLRASNELVVIESAGSPVELNLKRGDIVNMAVARYANAPVLLVGDIDRGGIFAQLLGTLWLLDPEERDLLRGFIVNKFRGDLSLFQDGIQITEEKSGVPVLGVVPYLNGLSLPDEDAVSIEVASHSSKPAFTSQTDVAILALPRIANFDDFDSLRAEPSVHIRHVDSVEKLGNPHAIIIPGTKSTMADLAWLRQTGLADAIIRFANSGGEVIGICGGYQMLGQSIHDPHHVESQNDSTDGLGLLPTITTFAQSKATYQVRARILNFSSLTNEMI